MNRRQNQQQIEQILRSAGITPGTWAREALAVREEIKEEVVSLPWTLTTELPAVVFDWDRWDFVEEVLLMDGMLVPSVNQVPLLDSHNRSSCDDVLGHVEGFSETDRGQYMAKDGLVYFAADEKSQRTRQKVVDGHLLDGSVGYQVIKSVWIPAGEEAVIKGRLFEGGECGRKISYSWLLKEFSVTPVGADVLAKVRTLCGTPR